MCAGETGHRLRAREQGRHWRRATPDARPLKGEAAFGFDEARETLGIARLVWEESWRRAEERAEAAGATLRVASKPDGGSQVTVDWRAGNTPAG